MDTEGALIKGGISPTFLRWALGAKGAIKLDLYNHININYISVYRPGIGLIQR